MTDTVAVYHMSNGDDADEAEDTEADADADVDAGDGAGEPVDPETLDERLDEVAADLEAAETEDDLDEVEAELDAVAADVETLPEPDEEDGDEDEDEDPKAGLEDRVEDLREDLEAQRGPYAEDVAERARDAAGTVRDTRWTEDGAPDVRAAVEAFCSTVDEAIDAVVAVPDAAETGARDAPAENVDGAAGEGEGEGEGEGPDLEPSAAALEDAADAIEGAGLDADDDEETIATLVEAVEDLEDDLEAAEEWDDLTVVEQLRTKGFYDTLTGETRKDYPPELSVVRIAEAENDPETILLALERFDSDFMEENCLDALVRLGPEEAFDEVNQRAQKRNKPPIEVLGKIGDPRALDTLLPFIEGDSDPGLQRVTLKAIGEIGDEQATQDVADRLVADDPEVRSNAARALGMIGDTRAIDPLSDLLGDDENDSVRASAAWALNQIGTERALEAASDHADDRSYLVQAQAERAADALETDTAGTDSDAGTPA